jgi:hypothetical protein
MGLISLELLKKWSQLGNDHVGVSENEVYPPEPPWLIGKKSNEPWDLGVAIRDINSSTTPKISLKRRRGPYENCHGILEVNPQCLKRTSSIRGSGIREYGKHVFLGPHIRGFIGKCPHNPISFP